MITSFDDIEFSTPDKVEYLYKYQPFNDVEKHPKWLEDLVNNNQIYLPSPKQFNDPWDCRVFFNAELLADPEYKKKMYSRLMDSHRREYPHITDSEREKLYKKNVLENGNDEFLSYMSRTMTEDIQQWCRIFCTCSKLNSRLLWSHYADSHKGICLQFNTKNKIFSFCMKVDYVEEFPVSDFTNNDPIQHIIPLITKDQIWKYEEEYRLIAQDHDNPLNEELAKVKDNLLIIPEDSLQAVIMGCAITKPQEDIIKNILHPHKGRIVLKKMIQQPNVYNLTTIDIPL